MMMMIEKQRGDVIDRVSILQCVSRSKINTFKIIKNNQSINKYKGKKKGKEENSVIVIKVNK